MSDEPNWEGLVGSTEHRTVGPVRAWCFQDAEWCYENALCPCCDALNVPKRWRGLHPAELLEELTKEIESLHAPTCTIFGCQCPIGSVQRLLAGEDA